MSPDIEAVRSFLTHLQDRICTRLEQEDGEGRFESREIEGNHGGLARPRVLSDGSVFERAAVNYTNSRGLRLPKAASGKIAGIEGRAFEAVSISLICHPRNPYAPTTHANFRFFCTDEPRVWWFGGGFDLTPIYGFESDAIHWHTVARDACRDFGPEIYPRMKQACDEYFFLPHRGECRGIGGLFFDDLASPSFEQAFALTRSLGESFLPAYLPIVERRKAMPYGPKQREFQKVRRGRYVEFNLIFDRGTRFGLQAGARTESVLASLPPEVSWRYDWQAEPGTEEARLDSFLQPRDWLGLRRAAE